MGKKHLGEQDTERWIILQCALLEYGLMVWSRFNLLSIGYNWWSFLNTIMNLYIPTKAGIS